MDSKNEKTMNARVPLGERVSFSTALLGQNVIYTFVNFYIMIFYTDMLGISAAAAGTLFLIARIWDAVNDLFMGNIVDKTRTRWGKCRPYLFFMPVPIAVSTVILFVVPDFSYAGKLVYAYVTYILWDMMYTTVDIPIWTLSGRMSTDSDERKTIISFGRVFSTFGSVIPVLLTIPLKNAFGGGDDAAGYFMAIAFFCAFVVPMMMQSAFFTRERAETLEVEKPTVMENMRAIVTNGPLLLMLASGLLGVLTYLPMVGIMYFATYNLGDEKYMMILAGLNLTSMALGCAAVPLFRRLLSGKALFIGSSLLASVFSAMFFFIGYGNLPLVYAFTFIIGILWGVPMVLRTSMMADTIEYMQLRSGKRSDGTIFSTLTLMGKINMGLGNFIAGIVLTVSGYVPNAVQTAGSLTGILMIMTLLPGVGALLTMLPVLFFKLTEERHREITEQLGSLP